MAKDPSIDSLWMRRSLDLPPDEKDIISREVTPADIEYLRKYKFPFLEIANAGIALQEPDHFMVVEAPNGGWPIQDRGDIILASPSIGALEIPPRAEETAEEKEEGEGGDEGEGAPTLFDRGGGTIINQTVMTAFDMVMLAVGKDWPEITIVDGSELMKWAAWAAAEDCDIGLVGFSPSERDKKKYERLRGLQREAGSVVKLGPGMSGR